MTKMYERHKESNLRYKAKMARFAIYMKPETKAEFAAYAAAKGESLVSFILRCAEQEIERNPLPEKD